MPLHRLIPAAVLALTFLGQSGPAVAEAAKDQTMTVSLPEAREIARRAAQRGQAGLARHVALGLLQADPQDVLALLVLSSAEAQLGNPQAAAEAGRTAWKAAPDDIHRYEAATLTAQALTMDGRHQQAKIWLRRAGQVAPDARLRSMARANHRAVSRTSPLSMQFSLSVAPSSNVNNGTHHDTILIFGEPFQLAGATRALSGMEATVGAAFGWRLSETPKARSEATLRLVGRKVSLSSEAKVQAPGARGGDYDYALVEAGLAHRFRPGAAPLVWTFGAAAGHSWSGGRDLADYLRLEGGAEYALTPRMGLALKLGAERQWRRDDASFGADILSVSGTAIRMQENGDRISLTLGLRDTQSANARVDHLALSAQLDWQRASPIRGIGLNAGASVALRRYGATAAFPAGRDDVQVGARLGLVFERLDYMGFAPTLDITATRTRSDYILNDARSLGVSFGVRSTF
ncbi:MAG: tetratricopeptide repeat protein [Pseudorhodobacter sp.]